MTSVTRAVLVNITVLMTLSLAATAATPLDHLNQAKRLLTAIPQESLHKNVLKKIDALRQHFAELVDAYQKTGEAPVPAAAASEAQAKRDTNDARVNWKALFSQVEKDLAGMLGGVPSVVPAGVQRQLEQFRVEVELFFSATLGPESERRPPQSTSQS